MKSKLLTILCLVSVILCSLELKAQVYFHTDKPFYVAGEVIWYKVYLPSDFESRQVAVKVVITNPSGKMIKSYFLKSQGKLSINGYYKTPYTLVSGNYEFRYFVSTEENQVERILTSFSIPIYNDLEVPDPNQISSSDNEIRETSLSNGDLQIEVRNNGTVGFNPGSMIDLVVNVKDQNGNPVDADMSVSVIDRGLIKRPVSQMIRSSNLAEGLSISSLSNTLYHMGNITGDSGEPLLGNVLGVYSRTEKTMFYTKSNIDGDFVLSLPDYIGEKPVQMIGYIFEEHPNINIKRQSTYSSNNTRPFTYNDDLEAYFEASRKRKKIFQYFKKNEAPISIEEVVREVKKLTPNGTFNIKEYEDFQNVAKFFNELINSQLNFPKNRDGTFSARMYNPEGRGNILHFTGDPIFIIDGKITRDADFIGKMPLDGVESVDLYFITKSIRDDFGTFGNSSFVFIHTTLPEVKIPEEEESDIFTISGILPTGTYQAVSQEDIEGNAPVFRPMVYWDPELITQRGTASLSFRHSSDVGSYDVVVVGRDISGRMGQTVYSYEITLQK